MTLLFDLTNKVDPLYLTLIVCLPTESRGKFTNTRPLWSLFRTLNKPIRTRTDPLTRAVVLTLGLTLIVAVTGWPRLKCFGALILVVVLMRWNFATVIALVVNGGGTMPTP